MSARNSVRNEFERTRRKAIFEWACKVLRSTIDFWDLCLEALCAAVDYVNENKEEIVTAKDLDFYTRPIDVQKNLLICEAYRYPTSRRRHE